MADSMPQLPVISSCNVVAAQRAPTCTRYASVIVFEASVQIGRLTSHNFLWVGCTRGALLTIDSRAIVEI